MNMRYHPRSIFIGHEIILHFLSEYSIPETELNIKTMANFITDELEQYLHQNLVYAPQSLEKKVKENIGEFELE